MTCPTACDAEMMEVCKKVKRVLDAKTSFSEALKANIIAFDKATDFERRIENLEKTNGKGQPSGIQKTAKHTGLRRKAG